MARNSRPYLGTPFRIRAGTDIETAEYADGCVVTMPTRALEFGYPLRTRSVGVHFKPWGLAPFLPMPAAELCDRPVTVEQVWGRPAIAELRDRLATADGPHEMLTLLEEELMRRLWETAGPGLVRQRSSVIAATSGAVAIGDLSVAAGVSSTHLAQRFKELIGVTPKRLARTYRFAATVFAINPAGPIDWGDLAGGAGYFDQARLGREFRAFTGLTPTRYVEVRRRFLREHPSHALDGRPLPADWFLTRATAHHTLIWGHPRAEERPMGKVVMYSTVSVDGFIADENDQPGPLFDWLVTGDVPLDESGELKVSQTSYDYTRAYWDQIGVTIAGRHVFDMTDGWDGKPPSGIDHVVVVTHRPEPEGWDPEAPFHFVDGVEAAVAKAQELAGDRLVEVAAGDVGGQVLAAGLVDEVRMDVVPVVFGSGKRYFGSVHAQHLLEDPDVVIQSNRVLHLRYRMRR